MGIKEVEGHDRIEVKWTSCPFCYLPVEEWEFERFDRHWEYNCKENKNG